ncbi:hypothetical protein EDD76_102230 [Kineothrix alysoides]|uniref:Uncharacterized protein n=1 Tax=Kineothrix alysoides TaxID=1469948 RepID=A0A4R1R5G6_9FIRM|nr:hypothetical protein [Kineothrix alysoides]TCL60532.1 hypothetical protein EDD76_102230 [Kineothrix alysoides]
MFTNVAIKELSAVEVNNWTSNQHEFHGVAALKKLFGYNRQYLDAQFFYLSNNGTEVKESGDLTWYDARANSIDRTEFRLYYTANGAVLRAQAGHTLIVGCCSDGSVKIIIVKKGTQLINYIINSLGMPIGTSYKFVNEAQATQFDALL